MELQTNKNRELFFYTLMIGFIAVMIICLNKGV